MSTTASAAERFERETSIRLKQDWIETALLGRASQGSSLSESQYLYGCFLESDMNQVGAGCFPPNLKEMHRTHLTGQYVSQVDEIVNIAAPIKQRYKAAGKGRCLKFHLTDGVQRVQAVEMTHIAALHPLMPAGLKVAISNAEVQKGLLLLRPENIQALGGQVAHLEEARQRMMQRWAQPAEGSQQNLLAEMTKASWRHMEGPPNPNAPQSNASAQQPTGGHTLPASVAQNSTPNNTHPPLGVFGGGARAPALGVQNPPQHTAPNNGWQGRAPGVSPALPRHNAPAAMPAHHHAGPSNAPPVAPPTTQARVTSWRADSLSTPASTAPYPTASAAQHRGEAAGSPSTAPNQPRFGGEPQSSQSQQVGRLGMSGFSRSAARTTGLGIASMSQRPSNLGPQRTSNEMQTSWVPPGQISPQEREGNQMNDSSGQPAHQAQPPCPNPGNAGGLLSHQSPSSLAGSAGDGLQWTLDAWPDDDMDDDCEGPAYVDMVPDTEMQDEDWNFAPGVPVDNPDPCSSGAGVSDTRGSFLASKPSNPSAEKPPESLPRKRQLGCHAGNDADPLDLTSPPESPQHPPRSAHGPPPTDASRRRSLAGHRGALGTIDEESDCEEPDEDEPTLNLRDILSSSDSDVDEQNTHRIAKRQKNLGSKPNRRVMRVDSSPEPSEGDPPSPHDQQEDVWHSASDQAYSPPPPNASAPPNAGPSHPPRKKAESEASPGRDKAQPGTQEQTTRPSSTRRSEDHDRELRVAPDPPDPQEYIKLTEFQQRLQEMRGQSAVYECVVRAKISQGTKLGIRKGPGGSMYVMQLCLSDDNVEISATLDHNLVLNCVGLSPEEATARLRSGDKGVQSHFDNLTKQLACFIGMVQLKVKCSPGDLRIVITNLSKDEGPEIR